MAKNSLPQPYNDTIAELTRNQFVAAFVAQHPGFDQRNAVPGREALQHTMQNLVDAAHKAEALNAWPAGSKLGHLDDIVSAIGWLSEQQPKGFRGESAKLFNDAFIRNPENEKFAHELEFALAAIEKQSPETWHHIQNHTALTMLYFERQCAAEDKVRGAKSGTAFNERKEEALLLVLGALGHDIGKVAIAPELLHKATRIDTTRLEKAANAYDQTVPCYPEKAHDIAFLHSANEGKIIFPAQRDSVNFPEATLILDIGAGYTHGEMALTDEQQRQGHAAIWERINGHAAKAALPAWFTAGEQEALTMPRRGTVTEHEMAVIAMHDEMSEAFFKAASVPERFAAVTHIVSMDRFRQGKGEAPSLSDDEMKLANIVHTTDVLEALLAPRSYREALPVEQAIRIMRDDAARGVMNADITEHIVRNGTLDIYKPRTPGTANDLAAPTPPARKSFSSQFLIPLVASVSIASAIR